jgi:hypothetical protein
MGNTISDNLSSYACGGILCSYGSNPTIEDNYIANNSVGFTCGGIGCVSANPYITGNTITGNESGLWMAGIGAGSGSAPVVHDNDITDNHSVYSAGVGLEFNGTITNNRITGNIADSCGGGITFETNSSPTMIRHNLVDNNTAVRGAGIWCRGYSSPVIDSCTISNNNGDGVTCDSFSAPEIHYCNICDNTGYGVQNSEPTVLVDAENNWWGDASGPCGAGPGTGDSVSEYVDFDPWLDRPVGIEEHRPVQPVATLLQVSPNPFKEIADIRYEIPGEVDSRQYALGSIRIYDISGRLVKSFSLPTTYSVLPTAVSWDGTDGSNRKLGSGVYFVKFQAGDYSATEKLLLIR